jgi:glycosyltransferase involved in cell wall biosynthesis
MVLSDFSGPEDGHRPHRDTQTDDPVRVIPIRSYQPVSATLAIAATVSVVIPARNEAANLPHVFASLPSWVDEIIVVDGHSVDDTVAVTRELCSRARVIAQTGRGKGDALQAGFNAATGDIIVSMDADGSTDGAEIIQFVGALLTGADFAKGSRFSGSGGSEDITPIRRTGNRVLGMLVNRMFRTQFTDLCYGYNAFWARHLEALRIDCTGFEVETLMNIRAAKAGLRIQEIPSIERPRLHGESNLNAIGDGWRILRLIAQEKFSWLQVSDAGPLTAGPPPVLSSSPAEAAEVEGA